MNLFKQIFTVCKMHDNNNREQELQFYFVTFPWILLSLLFGDCMRTASQPIYALFASTDTKKMVTMIITHHSQAEWYHDTMIQFVMMMMIIIVLVNNITILEKITNTLNCILISTVVLSEINSHELIPLWLSVVDWVPACCARCCNQVLMHLVRFLGCKKHFSKNMN